MIWSHHTSPTNASAEQSLEGQRGECAGHMLISVHQAQGASPGSQSPATAWNAVSPQVVRVLPWAIEGRNSISRWELLSNSAGI